MKADFFQLCIMLNLQSNNDNDTNVFGYSASGFFVVLSAQKHVEVNDTFV